MDISISAINESFHELPDDHEVPTPNASVDTNNNDVNNPVSVNHICEMCGRGFQTKSGLTKHSETHSNNSKYCCQICKKTFANKGHYEGHVNSHNKIKAFKCTQCPSKFYFKSSLIRHQKRCYAKSTEKSKSHICDLCGTTFTRKDILEDHLKGKHDGARPYRCLKCNTSFAWRSSLSKHLLSKKHMMNSGSLLE